MQLLEALHYECPKRVHIKGITAFRQELREFQEPQEVFQVRLDNQEEQVASSYLNGDVRLHSLQQNTLLRCIATSPQEELPVTTIRFRPASYQSRCKRVLVSGGSDGSLCHWHCSSGKYLSKITEQDNQILAMDYSPSGQTLATAGQDYKIRLYDENIKALSQTLHGGYQQLGHTNRVFSIKWIDENSLITGGWDNNILIWDIRTKTAVGNMMGANISGDSLDLSGDIVLAGSYRNKEQLQLYSLSQRRLLRNIEWDTNRTSDDVYVYCSQFSKYAQKRYVLAGSSGRSSLKVFDTQQDYACIATVDGFKKGCYSLDSSPGGNIVFGTANGEIYVLHHNYH